MTNDNKFRFTKGNIEKLKPTGKRAYYYDTAEPNLMLQVTPTGVKTYYVYKRIHGKPTRTYLGTTDVLKTPDMARIEAGKVKLAINQGEDPHKQQRQYKEDTLLQQLYNDFVDDRERFLGERTIQDYKNLWHSKLVKLGKRPLKDITGELLREFHKQVTVKHGKYIANHCIKMIKTMFNYAIKEERFDGKNPAISVKMNKVEARVRYLEHNEMKKFLDTVYAYEDTLVRDIILMLVFTGARRGNVFSMRWQDIDMDAKIWKIPQTKTANNVTLALVEQAVGILKNRQSEATNEWVFPSPRTPDGHVIDIKKSWAIILKRAGITNLRLHDLRHTLATYLVANGADAFVVKRALAHKSLQSTQIYVNLGVEHLREKLNDTVDKMLKIGQ